MVEGGGAGLDAEVDFVGEIRHHQAETSSARISRASSLASFFTF